MGVRSSNTLKGQASVANGSRVFHTSPHASLSRQFLLKTIGIVGIVGLLAIAAAANQGMENQKNNAAKNSAAAFKASLSTPKTQGISNQSQPPAETQTSVDSGTTSNSSSTTTGSASNTSDSSVSVTVNGQSIPIKQNGTTQKTITTPSGSASVSVDNNQSTGGNNRSSSFTTTHVNSNMTGGNESIQVESHNGTP
jgi:hypothetical protein